MEITWPLILVLCEKLEDDLKVMMGRFVEMSRKGLKDYAYKREMMVLGEEKGLECEIMWMRGVCSKFHSSNIGGVCWMNQLLMEGRW